MNKVKIYTFLFHAFPHPLKFNGILIISNSIHSHLDATNNNTSLLVISRVGE